MANLYGYFSEEVGMVRVADLGDYDLYRSESPDGGFYDIKVIYHDNVNIKDKDALVSEADWNSIEEVLKEIEEDSDVDTDSSVNFIEELLNI